MARILVIMFMHIEQGLYDFTQPKMAVLHSFPFSTKQISVTFLFSHSILIRFAAYCMV